MGKKSKDVARYNITDRYVDGAAEREKAKFPFPTAESMLKAGIVGGAFSEVHTAAPRATEAAVVAPVKTSKGKKVEAAREFELDRAFTVTTAALGADKPKKSRRPPPLTALLDVLDASAAKAAKTAKAKKTKKNQEKRAV